MSVWTDSYALLPYRVRSDSVCPTQCNNYLTEFGQTQYVLLGVVIILRSLVRLSMPYSVYEYSGGELRENYHVVAVLR